MMGWSPRCYITSFVESGSPVLEKKIFEGFLPYMGVAAIGKPVLKKKIFEGFLPYMGVAAILVM